MRQAWVVIAVRRLCPLCLLLASTQLMLVIVVALASRLAVVFAVVQGVVHMQPV